MDTAVSAALITRINELVVPHGQLALWALGQAGYIIKGGSTVAYIDPYLSDPLTDCVSARRFPPPLDPALASNAQVVFATHEHADHVDPATLVPLMRASPNATLITSPEGREIAVGAGIATERVVVPRLGVANDIAGLRYTAMPAAHYEYEVNEQGQSRWMGFVIECNGVRLYHSGDTVIFSELLEALVGQTVDLALLVTNGRDFFREEVGLVGNMWPGEAVSLAQRIGARVLIPMHNDLFAGNRVRSGQVFDELDTRAPFLRCHMLQPGELYIYAG